LEAKWYLRSNAQKPVAVTENITAEIIPKAVDQVDVSDRASKVNFKV
jgi:hypothetical protein